ncbi:MAG TPA: TIGR00725 family protein [Actinomycetota bacterium]|nr:TIGR00725 family protein [Actinomycetota bacterium]
MNGPYVAVCGPGTATGEEEEWAEEVGRRLGEAGAVVVCGGLGGVMDAAARGAAAAGGTVIGILPGEDRLGASEHLTVAIPTGMGEARNALIARVADAVIAIGGEWGTLSEIALARKMGRPVVGLATWALGDRAESIVHSDSPEEAVGQTLELLG